MAKVFTHNDAANNGAKVCLTSEDKFVCITARELGLVTLSL